MARIIVDKGALERGEPAIQIVRGPRRANFRQVEIYSPDGSVAAVMEQFDEPGQDGTRIQIRARYGADGYGA